MFDQSPFLGLTWSSTAQTDRCMTSKHCESYREQMLCMLLNHSRGTLMSYSDRSARCCFKSNIPHLTSWPSEPVCFDGTPKAAQLFFRGDPLVKSYSGGKLHVFWRGSPGKSRIPGAKYHIIGVAAGKPRTGQHFSEQHSGVSLNPCFWTNQVSQWFSNPFIKIVVTCLVCE